MQPDSVVEYFDVLENRGARFGARREIFVMNQFRFQRTKEAFHDGVVPAVALAAHAANHAVFFQQRLVVTTGVLTSTIAVVNQAGRRTPIRDRHL